MLDPRFLLLAASRQKADPLDDTLDLVKAAYMNGQRDMRRTCYNLGTKVHKNATTQAARGTAMEYAQAINSQPIMEAVPVVEEAPPPVSPVIHQDIADRLMEVKS